MSNLQDQFTNSKNQFFTKNENTRLIENFNNKTDEVITTLKQYNSLVEKNNQAIAKREKQQDKEELQFKSFQKNWTIFNAIISFLGVVASVLIGIFC